MKWNELLKLTTTTPLIRTENLRAFHDAARAIEVQLSRWTKSGKLLQLKRGVYLVAPPARQTEVTEYFIAATLRSPSYISLEKALEFHGLIPEAVPLITSVTTKNPARFETPVGVFTYRHLQRSHFWGYDTLRHNQQMGAMAKPEKALLDLIYLNNIRVTRDYLHELRLQNTEKLNSKQLADFAARFKKKTITDAAMEIILFLKRQKKGENPL